MADASQAVAVGQPQPGPVLDQSSLQQDNIILDAHSKNLSKTDHQDEMDLHNASGKLLSTTVQPTPRLDVDSRVSHDTDENSHESLHAARNILIQAVLAFLPMVVLTSVFLGLLASHIVHKAGLFILVDFEATRLLVPVQISATIAIPTVGLLMKLWSYRVGKSLHLSIRNGTGQSQLKPNAQYSAMLTEHLFFPGPVSLLTFLVYGVKQSGESNSTLGRLRKRIGRREPFPATIRHAAGILGLCTSFGLLLSLLAPLLQIFTTTERFDQVTDVGIPENQYGRMLPPRCAVNYFANNQNYSCSLTPQLDGDFLLANSSETIKVVNNVSRVSQVLYDDLNQMAFLAPAEIPSTVDYVADTLGVQGTCISRKGSCNMRVWNATTIFQSCSELSQRILTVRDSYFAEQNFIPGQANPFHFWIWAALDHDQSESDILSNDPEAVLVPGAIFFLMDCEIAVHNYTYSIKNGVLDLGSPKGLVDEQSTYVVADLMVDFTEREVYKAMRLAAASVNSTAQVARHMSTLLPQIALAYSAGVFTAIDHRNERERESLEVAKVSLPLVVLIGLFGYLMGLSGLLLALYAYQTLQHCPEAAPQREGLKLEAVARQAWLSEAKEHRDNELGVSTTSVVTREM